MQKNKMGGIFIFNLNNYFFVLSNIKFYTVAVRELSDSYGNIREVWRVKNKIHCDHGPALVVRDRHNNIIAQEWYQHGKVHRENAPAFIGYNEKTLTEVWSLNAHQCRRDGPCRTVTNRESGLILEQLWAHPSFGRHREDGPTLIFRHNESGIVIREEWYLKNRLHRVDGPAKIIRDKDTGIAIEEQWRWHGKRHRSEGPAFILRDAITGAINERLHFHHGKPVVRYKTSEPNLQ